MPRMPLSPASPCTPKVACILLWYPLFTQPFIFRELEGLRKLLPCSIYTLYGANLVHCSNEMRAAATNVQTNGIKILPRLLWTLLTTAFRHPRRFFGLVRNHLFRPWPSLEIFGENCWAFCMAFLLKDEIARSGATILYAPWPRGTAQTAWVLAKLLGLPFVMTVRGDNLLPADPDLADKMQDASAIRTNNAADKTRIEHFGQGAAQGKTHLIYNCLTLPEKSLDQSPHIASYTPARPLRLMALGRFDKTKGFEDLIAACGLLAKVGLSFHLTLAGGGGLAFGLGHLEGALKSQTKALGLEQHISFPGLISHNELPKLLAEHDIFLAPCVIDKDGRRDGIPNTLLEAMSASLPVIATNIHALPEVVHNGETGLLVPPHDPHAIAAAIQTMAANPQEAARMGRNAKDFTAHLFDPQTNAKALAELLATTSKLCKKDGPCAE